MIAPVSPAEFLPARLEGVSSKHKDREVSPFEKSRIELGAKVGVLVECRWGSSHPMMMMPWMTV